MEAKRISIPWTTVALALIIALVVPWAVWADVFVWDGDIVTPSNQTTVNLGTVSPGAVITKAVSFQLQCAGKQHVDEGQTVGIAFNLAGSTVPGGSLSATAASIGAIPASWPDDTTGGGATNCPSPAPILDDNGNSSVTITAPTTPGPYTFVVAYNSSLSPAGNGDPQAVTGPNPSVTFNLVVAAPSDTTPPTINCTVPNQAIWYAADVTVPCTASDPSGLQNPADASFTLSTSVAPGTETDSAQTSSRLVCDTHGNCATAGPYTFKVDRKAPVVLCGTADSIWHDTNQSVSCTASDGGSGLANPGDASFSLSTSVAADTETDNAYTNSRVVADNVGNSYTAGPIGPFKIDRKAPQLSSCDSPDGLWHAANVTLYCHYTDGGSGPATQDVALSTNVAAGSETADAVASAGGAQACDNVGNCAVSPADIAGNKVDRKAPSITIVTPAHGADYFLTQAVAANYSCSDGGSGVASCAGPVSNGSNIDTASVGPKTFTVNATDNVGNTSAATSSYRVIFNWTGFFRPVDNPPILNVAKAGSAIPVKFSLAGNQGLGIFAPGYPKVWTIACDASAPQEPVEETVTAGQSSLSYDPLVDQYVYVWKTNKAWAGTCRQLEVKLIDGTTRVANFSFK